MPSISNLRNLYSASGRIGVLNKDAKRTTKPIPIARPAATGAVMYDKEVKPMALGLIF